MTFKELQPGRYNCRVTDWALTEVETFNNALKVTIQLAIDVNGESVSGWWDGLVKKKDGSINEKTLETLLSAGFLSSDIYTLNSDPQALDTTKAMEVTIGKDDKGRTTAEWLNSAGRSGLKKVELVKKKDLVIEAALNKAIKEKGAKKKIKNHAPGAVDEELGF